MGLSLHEQSQKEPDLMWGGCYEVLVKHLFTGKAEPSPFTYLR